MQAALGAGMRGDGRHDPRDGDPATPAVPPSAIDAVPAGRGRLRRDALKEASRKPADTPRAKIGARRTTPERGRAGSGILAEADQGSRWRTARGDRRAERAAEEAPGRHPSARTEGPGVRRLIASTSRFSPWGDDPRQEAREPGCLSGWAALLVMRTSCSSLAAAAGGPIKAGSLVAGLGHVRDAPTDNTTARNRRTQAAMTQS